MNVAEGLAREIRRITHLLRDYEALKGMPNVIVEPAIAVMNHALEEACLASGSGDIAHVLRSYENLKGFEK